MEEEKIELLSVIKTQKEEAELLHQDLDNLFASIEEDQRQLEAQEEKEPVTIILDSSQVTVTSQTGRGGPAGRSTP